MIKKIFIWAKENIILLMILAIAAAARAYGIYFDYPLGVNFIWDEIFSVSYLLDVIQYKTIYTASQYQYPLLLPLLYVPGLILRVVYLALSWGIFSVDALKEKLIEGGMGQIYIIVRWYSVFFGTATVWLIYKSYKLIFDRRFNAYWAALVYALALVPVFMAHWGKAHSAMVFFLVLSLYFILRFEREKNKKYFLFSSLAAAASLSIHYLGVSAAIWPLVGWLINRRDFKISETLKSAAAYLGVASFFYLMNYKGFFGIWANNAGYLQSTGYAGMFPVGIIERFYYVFRDSFLVEPVFFFMFILALALGWKILASNKLARYILWGLAANYLLMAALAVPHMSRWLLVFLTLALPLGVATLTEFSYQRGLKEKTIMILIAALLLPNIYFVGRWLNILNTNTRIEAATWLKEKLKINDGIYSFDMYFDVPLSYEAALWHRDFNARQLSKKLNYIIEHKEKFAGQGMNFKYDYGYNRFATLGGGDTEYIIISYWENINSADRLPSGMSREDANSILNEVKKYYRLEKIKEFYPTGDRELIASGVIDYLNNPLKWGTLLKLDKSGPLVEIYKLK